ncbi:DUF2399 domain-containing protein [Nocardia sp. CA-084685]|uniref:DUF2399 domain-containing protein n=1 Tax=Nocardia sp. CA-084685 TaxID=3239970 RepID=UPI003D9671AB
MCTAGGPSSAGVRLLEPDAELYHQGDFHGEGLRIAAGLGASDVVPSCLRRPRSANR